MQEEAFETTGKVIWVCRENYGRSPVAEAFWRRLHPQIPTTSFGIDVDKPGQPITETGIADTLMKVMEAEHGIDLSGHKRRSIHEYKPEALGKAALIVILAEPEVIPPTLAMRPNALTHEIPDMKTTDVAETARIVELIRGSMEAIHSMLPAEFQDGYSMSEQAEA